LHDLVFQETATREAAARLEVAKYCASNTKRTTAAGDDTVDTEATDMSGA
jgi:hypothetical protein